MTDTQNVLFWLNLKFSAFFFKPKYFTQFPYFYVFRNLFAFLLNWFCYRSERYSFEQMNSNYSGYFFFKLRAKFQTITYVNSHLLKNHKFPLSEARKAMWIFFTKNEYFLEEIFLHMHMTTWPHSFARIFYEIFEFPNNCSVRNFHLYGRYLGLYSVEMFK